MSVRDIYVNSRPATALYAESAEDLIVQASFRRLVRASLGVAIVLTASLSFYALLASMAGA
jgi:hypothetical protein